MAHVNGRGASRSVRRKLMFVALITTAIALLLAGTALLTRDLRAYRSGLATDFETEARILALSTGAALAFDDTATAARNVAALSARPDVLEAAIYTVNGRLYAQYVRSGMPPAPQQLPRIAGGLQFSGGSIEVTHRIVQKGEWLGSIYLRGRYNALGRVATYLEILAIVGLLSLGIALALSGVLQRSITDPLRTMALIARRIVQERDYSLRARRSAEGEIGLLLDAFNKMLDEVQLRTRALEQSNTALTREVETRHLAEAALKEADRRKDEFLATLAHELRNPLAPISHAVKLLDLPAIDERRREWCRAVIGRQVGRMALLLDDLLDVSRITRGRLQLRKSRAELAAMVRSAVETARPIIEAKRHTLELHLPGGPIELEVDPLRISQALSNLLTNAAKYTDPGGRITLTAELLEDRLRFSVHDTGIGLAAASIPSLFEMFSQVDSPIDRAEGGLGIGLALVKGLVALHGGTAQAASDGPGRGSTFTIDLPAAVVVPPNSASGAATAGALRTSAGPRCSVLIADDNHDAADSLAMLLQSLGYATYVAHSGEEALAVAMREQPDTLILDIGMPDLSGHEVARRIRGQEWGRHALLLAVTGWGQQEDKMQAAAAGFDHHFTKPVVSDAIEMILADLDSRRRAGT